jgi:hypothetical protein
MADHEETQNNKAQWLRRGYGWHRYEEVTILANNGKKTTIQTADGKIKHVDPTLILPPTPRSIRFDAHINDLIEICLNDFFGGQTEYRDKLNYSVGSIRWLLKELAKSPQFSQEQQHLLKQIAQIWHDGLYGKKPTESAEKAES